MKNLLLGIVCLALLSCGGGDEDLSEALEKIEKLEGEMRADSLETAKNNVRTYTSKDIGWTIEIPGEDFIELSEEDSGYVSTIKFKKDEENFFRGSLISHEIKHKGEFEDKHVYLRNTLYRDFIDAGYDVDISSSKEKIDGVEFYAFHLTIRSPVDNSVIHRVEYNCNINGFDFTITIWYNNDKDKETMMRAWKNSKFEK